MGTKLLSVLFLVIITIATLPAECQQIVDTIQGFSDPTSIAANPATNKIYVANFNSNFVTVIDGATNNTVNITVGGEPQFLVVNSMTNKIYVTRAGGQIAVIDGSNNSVTTLNTGGYGLRPPVLNQITNKIYVGDEANNTVIVIDGSTLSTTSVPLGDTPSILAVNPVTNKIYVSTISGQTVTVIDGTTNQTSTVPIGESPYAVVVNTVTDKIFVTSETQNELAVIDGATLSVTTVQLAGFSTWVSVDSVTNKIYVLVNNSGNSMVTVIDGQTFSTTNVMIGGSISVMAVDVIRNQIYVTSYHTDGTGYVTVIDGATLSTTVLQVGVSADSIAVNASTNRAYVGNSYPDDTVSVIAGANISTPLQFVSVSPCRLIDTRDNGGPIFGGTSRNFTVSQLGGCNIPATAATYSLNVTVVPPGRLGFLTIWPTGEDQPSVSTMNSLDGRIKANAAIIPSGYQGAVSVFVNNTSNVLIDIDGYFAVPSSSTLQFFPLTPCRVVDTRNDNGPLAGPFLNADQERDFPVLESPCIPQGADPQAYSFNVTAVPNPAGQRLGFLTIWPKGEGRPMVSTLNNLTGTIVANAAIVPAGTGGQVAVYPNNTTDLLIDINGYFASPGTGGLSLYTLAPCRVLDTRGSDGNGPPFMGEKTVNVESSPCAPPATSQAYVFNATVVPPGELGFLTLWPDGEDRPTASTLNAKDGAITSNMAIVPTNNGSIDAFANDLTQLILDISSYFAP